MKIFLIFIFVVSSLFGALNKKSAIVYYGEDISYSMLGIHDYIIVEPSHIDTNLHGFRVYKDKIYAYVSIGEIDKDIEEYKYVKKEWIVGDNKSWNSDVLDLTNPQYREFLFAKMIEPRRKKGFKNFFFDTLDSYQLISTQKKRQESKAALVLFINEFHKRYPKSKLIVNRGFEIIDEIHDSLEAVLFESYYRGVGGEKLSYTKVTDEDREWLDVQIDKIQSYNLPVIAVDYLEPKQIDKAKKLVSKLEARGLIPYVAYRELDTYGVSSKNAIKREIFTLVDESKVDRTLLEAHQYGALVFEYMGYIQKLHDINQGLPNPEKMNHYAGVVIWLRDYYAKPQELIEWAVRVKKMGIKLVFVSNFGLNANYALLKDLGIEVVSKDEQKRKLIHQDKIMGFEIEPSLTPSGIEIHTKSKNPLLVYRHQDKKSSTPAALTSWGGYAVGDAFMMTINNDNLWVINPFEFFKKALALKDLLVPDVTTQNGKRLLFTHVDGDGIMNRVEGDFGYYSGDAILNKILKVYKIPHSISVIGAEISPQGLYPKLSKDLMKIAKQMYALENVEPATHTFTHPFFWGKIQNDNLDEQYRLKPKEYKFSLSSELSKPLEDINIYLDPKHKAKSVFWSGDCAPRVNALKFAQKNHILNTQLSHIDSNKSINLS
jgi:hypothetical protein